MEGYRETTHKVQTRQAGEVYSVDNCLCLSCRSTITIGSPINFENIESRPTAIYCAMLIRSSDLSQVVEFTAATEALTLSAAFFFARVIIGMVSIFTT